MNKIVKLGIEARNELVKGAEFIAECVKSTLGPFGQNFFLEKGNKITNDGVTIAKEIWLKDEVKNRGVRAFQEVATRTNNEAGDGTTTAIILADTILKEAVKHLGDEDIIGKKRPIEVVNQIEKEKNEVIEKLSKMAEKIKTKEELINSAKVSVEDEKLGNLIGSMQWELGKDGVILAEETAEKNSSIEKINGLRIDNGFGTSILINNQEKQTLDILDTKIILTDYSFIDSAIEEKNGFNPIKKIVDSLVRTGARNITIVARAFSANCIRTCLENINKGAVRIYPINAPYVDQKEIMQDLAAVLGGKFYHHEESRLEDMQLIDVGYAHKIVARRFDAVLTGKTDKKGKERVEKRIKELKDKLAGSKSEFEKKGLEQRISQLQNGFALLKVGANSETERNWKKDKADDAVNAVRAAFQEGVVDGAGLAFKKIAKELPEDYILKRPLMSIYEQINFSAPKDWKAPDWVKDPIKVLRVALENACSVAGTLATASGVVVKENDKPKYVEEIKK
jgi:chaperonin GroEL